jgi:hypothetical protein
MRTAVVLAALLATCATTAHAEDRGVDARAEAKRLAARAQIHFDLGEYGLAIVDYREAYRLHPVPGLLYNLAQAYRLSGDCVSATVMYTNYLRLAPRSPHRGLARQHISELADCNRRHTGDPVDDSFVLASAESSGDRALALGLGASRAARADRVEGPGHREKVTGIAIGAGGAAMVLAGIFFSAQASETADEVSRRYDEGEAWDRIEDLDRRGRRQEVAGAAFVVAGGLAIVTGATLYAIGARQDRHAATLGVAPAAKGKGATVSLSWGF